MPSFGTRLFDTMNIIFDYLLRKKILILLFTSLLFLVYFISRPYLFIETEQGLLLFFSTFPGDKLSLRFIHSVHRTPVIENIVTDAEGNLIVVSTEYESFGVGMPFLAEEGTLKMVGTRFVLDDINRSFRKISLRTGPEAKLSIIYRNQTYPIYQNLAGGTLVNLRVGPYYSRWFNL